MLEYGGGARAGPAAAFRRVAHRFGPGPAAQLHTPCTTCPQPLPLPCFTKSPGTFTTTCPAPPATTTAAGARATCRSPAPAGAPPPLAPMLPCLLARISSSVAPAWSAAVSTAGAMLDGRRLLDTATRRSPPPSPTTASSRFFAVPACRSVPSPHLMPTCRPAPPRPTPPRVQQPVLLQLGGRRRGPLLCPLDLLHAGGCLPFV